MMFACRRSAGSRRVCLLVRRLAEVRSPAFVVVEGRRQKMFALRRATTASNRPVPGAGAALFLYHRYFSRKKPTRRAT